MMNLDWVCPTKILTLDIIPLDPSKQVVPGWSGFHTMIATHAPSHIEIGYYLINGSPTEYSTVYTVLKTAQKMVYSLKQKEYGNILKSEKNTVVITR